ncbi:MAG: hypothetical protein NDI61_06200 [Bdellovibrionaceae bacterium]|nr:hypothetical protein [Pseudobdellovibrionaceae bacterium]
MGGYASEILFTGGSCKIGGDDLTAAVKWVEGMMQSEDFRKLAAKLPDPAPGTLDMIEDSTVRAFIDYQIHMCIKELEPLGRQIQLIAEKLYEQEELTGDEVSALFN